MRAALKQVTRSKSANTTREDPSARRLRGAEGEWLKVDRLSHTRRQPNGRFAVCGSGSGENKKQRRALIGLPPKRVSL